MFPGVENGDLEAQRQREDEEDEEERSEDAGDDEDEKRPERSCESTIHTVPELLTDTLQVPEL